LFMGRLIHIKGLDLLITALHNIPGIQLQIAGDGPERTRLERLAKCCRISHQFHSWVDFDKTLELLENADIVVVPSRIYPSGRSEGSPMIIMEAMASGCAVIASNTGGIKDVIIDGINGMLFPANNASALKMKLLLLIENSELRRRISYCARSDAQRFDVKHTAQAFKKIFQHFH